MTISQERKEERSLNLESLTWNDLTWVNIERPTEREIEYLSKNYSFHRLDLDDCLSRKQRPKIDVYEDYLFLIFHFSIFSKLTRISTYGQVSIFIGKGYLITLHDGQLKPLTALFRGCQIDEETRRENLSYGSAYLLYRILDRAVDAYFPVLDKILGLLEDAEDAVFDENVPATREVAILRRDIITQRRIMFPNRTTIAVLEGKLQQFATVDMSVYFGDLMDHLNKICETLNECEEVIEVFKDADYVLGTERLNRIIRVLTILGSIALPFIVVSSMYGMNIPMPIGEPGSLQSFLILLVLMSAISGVMLYLFRRQHWI